MITYVDASVLIRLVFEEPGALDSWEQISHPVSSELIRVECMRAIDRARLLMPAEEEVLADRRAIVLDTIGRFELVQVTGAVLDRAADPFPTTVGTLDAIHLATALLVRGESTDAVSIVTHDRELATAARSMGFVVTGI